MSEKNPSGNQFGYGYNPNQDPYAGYTANYSNGYDYNGNNMGMQNNSSIYNNVTQQYGHEYEQPYMRDGMSYETPVSATNNMRISKNSRLVSSVVAIFLMFMGISFAATAFFVGISSSRFFKTAVAVDAQISDIESYRDNDGDISHQVYVDYYYDTQYYQHVKLDSYSSSMYIGKIVRIHLDPDNPTNIRTKSSTTIIVVVFGIVGCAMLIGGIICLISGIKKKRKKV